MAALCFNWTKDVNMCLYDEIIVDGGAIFSLEKTANIIPDMVSAQAD